MIVHALIPARGGSKGIPRKNLQTLPNGKTLLGNAIDIVRKSGAVQTIFVSTDDPAIIHEAGEYGAFAIVRPAELATDNAPSDDVLLHALGEIPSCDVLAFVQCTSPLMTPQDIAGTVRMQQGSDYDLCVAISHTDALQVRITNNQLFGVGFNVERPTTRRQDRRQCYEIAGSIWAIDVPRFLQRLKIYSSNIGGYVTDGPRLEIDSWADLDRARRLMSQGVMVE